ncbi:MAG: DUF2252 family protein [Candidatus Riflebacteria bacterium]|nr:DUF2252 family protein [Candidatus Riflebacteria bacterium]
MKYLYPGYRSSFVAAILGVAMTLSGLCPVAVSARDFGVMDVSSEIARFNATVAKERPNAYKEKLAAMKVDAFCFLRATDHLMIADIQSSPSLAFLNTAPAGLCQGDMHINNFGVLYFPGKKGSYSPDDLDEAHNAPLAYDLFRLCVSLRVGFHDIIDKGDKNDAVDALIDGYLEGLSQQSNPDWPACALPNFLGNFIDDASSKSQRKLLEKWVDSKHLCFMHSDELLPVDKSDAVSLNQTLQTYFNQRGKAAGVSVDEVRILDLVRREGKGLSSIGLWRYFALLRGDAPDGSHARLIEIKQMRPSCLGPGSPDTQARDTMAGLAAAHRDRDIFVGNFPYKGMRFLVRELYPWSLRYDVNDIKSDNVSKFAHALGAIAADFHGQSGKGSAIAGWVKANRDVLSEAAHAYAKQVREDWKEFSGKK